MTTVETAASFLAVMGLVGGAAALLSTRSPGVGVPFMLDVWTAAGLLRLSADRSWQAIAVAGAIVLVRRLVSPALLSGA